MEPPPPPSLPLHGVSVGDWLSIRADSSGSWRAAEVVAVEGDHTCDVVYEDREWERVFLDGVRYRLRRNRGRLADRCGDVAATGKGESLSSLGRKVDDNTVLGGELPCQSPHTSYDNVKDALLRGCSSLAPKTVKSARMVKPVGQKDVGYFRETRRSRRLRNGGDGDIGKCIEEKVLNSKTRSKCHDANCVSSSIPSSFKSKFASCRRSIRIQKKLAQLSSLDLASPVLESSSESVCPTSSLNVSNSNGDSDIDCSQRSRSLSSYVSSSDDPFTKSLSPAKKRLRAQHFDDKFFQPLNQNLKCSQKNSTYDVKVVKKLRSSRLFEDSEKTTYFSDSKPLLTENYGHKYLCTGGPCCYICQITAANNFLVQCKVVGCLGAVHNFCLISPFKEPERDWMCPNCEQGALLKNLTRGDKLLPKKIQKIVGCRRLSDDKVNSVQDEFLIKWELLSHDHDCWVPLKWLYIKDRNRLFSYQKKYRYMVKGAVIDERRPDWFLIDRIIACRKKANPHDLCDACNQSLIAKHNEDFEFLVKWVGLDYCDSTWESSPTEEFLAEVRKFVQRHKRVADTESYKDKTSILPFEKSPSYLAGGTLYGYQLVGLNWILNSFLEGNNVILADEMGLGKTIQVVSFVQCLKRENLTVQPVLIIAPKSILFHWQKEFRNWAPNINAIVYQGNKASRRCIQLHEFYSSGNVMFDALITNYELVLLDNSVLKKFNWSSIIIDEGHKIKNLKCKLSRVLKHYSSDFRLLLTGTPLQNTMLELFALLHFLDPEKFSDPEAEAKSFSEIGTGRHYEQTLKISELHELLRPRMLRRMKCDVLPGCIPVKKWVEVPCALTDPQRELYIDILEKNYRKLNEGILNGKKVILNFILMQLRKCCNHPFLFPGQENCNLSREAALSSMIASSGKLQLLEKLLPKLKERGNRVLLFSQMTTMLDILEDFLIFLHVEYFRIDGATSISVRQHQMKEFNDPESNVFVFLISTRAGGLGIDLPSADRVIIYDPDFNPFMDLQAQSRAHRIGQTKPVVVYQLITKSTVEEKILQKSKKKLAVENLVMNHSREPTEKELHAILLHGASKIMSRGKLLASTIRYDDNAIVNLLKLDPAPSEKCSADDNGYLGSIHSFSIVNDDDPLPQSPKAQDWKNIMGPVEDSQNGAFGRGKRQKKAVKYNNDDDSGNDDSGSADIYSPESSFSSESEETTCEANVYAAEEL